jgi:hypothetical protein
VLLQRRAGSQNGLELRIGGQRRLLDRSPSGFLDADVQHDSHGRLVVTWRRSFAGGGAAQAFAWTSSGGKQQVSDAANGVNAVTLSVAPSGRAGIAYRATESVFVARRAAGRGFQKAEMVASTGAGAVSPGIGVTSGGRIVAAWSDGRSGILARAASGGASFGPMQVVLLRAPQAGAALVPGSPKVVMTAGGRAVVSISSDELGNHQVLDSRVEVFDWPVGAAHPSGAATLSRDSAAGTADIVAQGTAAVIAWTQRSKGSPRALWVARWTTKGIQRPNLYDTRALGLAVLLTPAPNGALDLFYRASGPRWFTVRLSAAGRFTGTSSVTPAGESVSAIDVASAARRRAAAWTRRDGPARVEVARP